MESKRGTHSADVIDENSPEAVKRRKRSWTIWIAANLLVAFVLVPGTYMLISDAAVQIADGGTHTRAQAAAGMYILGAGGTFCFLAIMNIPVAIAGLLARSARERRRNQPQTLGHTRQYSNDT